MALTIILAATLRKYFPDYDPASGHSLDIQPGMTIREVLTRLEIPQEEVKLIMINGLAAKWDSTLQGDERVAFFPPVGGG